MFRKMEIEFVVIGLLLLVCSSAAKGSRIKTDEIENYSEIMKYVGNLEGEMHEMKTHIKTLESEIEKQSDENELLKQEVLKLKIKSPDASQNIQIHPALPVKADSYKTAQTSKTKTKISSR